MKKELIQSTGLKTKNQTKGLKKSVESGKISMTPNEETTNFVCRMEFLGKGGIVKPNGFISILRPYNTCSLDKLIINYLLNFIGEEYMIIEEEAFSDGLAYHTNLKLETLLKYDPETNVEIKMKRDDLNFVADFQATNRKDGTLMLFCRKKSITLRKKLLKHILKCYGQECRITFIKKFDDDYMLVGTNIPSDLVDEFNLN